VTAFAEIKSDYARLKPLLSGLERFDLDQQQLNNAVLLNYLIYFHNLNDFAALERLHQGDTRATIQSIIKLAESEPGDPFHAISQAALNATSAGDLAGISGTEPVRDRSLGSATAQLR
jgi:hypothetical protein